MTSENTYSVYINLPLCHVVYYTLLLSVYHCPAVLFVVSIIDIFNVAVSLLMLEIIMFTANLCFAFSTLS